jgi:hypothetical protein
MNRAARDRSSDHASITSCILSPNVGTQRRAAAISFAWHGGSWPVRSGLIG